MSEQAYEDWTIVSRISQHGRHRDHTRVALVPSFQVVLLAHNCKYIVNTFVNSNKKLKWLVGWLKWLRSSGPRYRWSCRFKPFAAVLVTMNGSMEK